MHIDANAIGTVCRIAGCLFVGAALAKLGGLVAVRATVEQLALIGIGLTLLR